MSNDGRSIADHLRETEEAANRDSSADSSATRQSERGRGNDGGMTNRGPSEERKSQQRMPPRGNSKDRTHA
jgi:hypothetical protein